jgi:phage-related baseplate assembly protein
MLEHAPVSHYTYEYHAVHAVLKALGITIDIRNGDIPGDIVIEIAGVQSQFAKKVVQEVQKMVDDPAIRPLTERVLVTLSKKQPRQRNPLNIE